MNREVISDKQGISIISLFIIGSSIVLTIAGEAEKDIWIAIVLAILTALPIILINARLLALFPGKDLYEILNLLLGKFLGSVVSMLFIMFSLFLGGLVLRVFGDFIFTVSFPDTPQIVSMTLIGFLCVWAVKEGIETIGRWSQAFLIGIIILIISVSLLLISKMEIDNIKPILNEGIRPLLDGTFHAFIFPFTQIIVFTTFFSCVKSKSSYRVYVWGVLIGGAVLYISSVTNLLVLGSNGIKSVYFPTYESASRLNIGRLGERLEVIIAVALLVGGFVKVCMCLLSTCNGIVKVLGIKDYRFIVTPIGLLIINLSYFIHDSAMGKAEFASDIYPTYAFPFQVLLPLSIFVVAEIKKRRLKKKST